jgi:hypothetical protein
VSDQAGDEISGGYLRQLTREMKYDDYLNAQLGKQGTFFLMRGQIVIRSFGEKDDLRPWTKGDHYTMKATLLCCSLHRPQQMLMAEVDSVKGSHGHQGGTLNRSI